MMKVQLRSAYGYDADQVSLETGLKCEDKTLAQQNFKDEVDINTIVERFGLTGQLPDNVRIPQYGDFVDVVDYHTAMNKVIEAREGFMSLPATIRARFNNDPGELVAFCSDPANYSEAEKLGIVVPKGTGAGAQAPAESSAEAKPTE